MGESLRLFVKDLLTNDWLKAIVTILIGAFLTLKFTKRKEVFDRDTAVKQRTAAYHIQRKEHLAAIITSIVEARLLFAEARSTHYGIVSSGYHLKEPEPINEIHTKATEVYYDLLGRGTQALTSALMASELYERLPDVAELKKMRLSAYVEAVCNLRLKHMYSINNPSQEQKDIYNHSQALIDDLRELMGLEELLARTAMSNEAMPTRVPLAIPYLRFNDPILPYFPYKVEDLDYTHLEGWNEEQKG